jgi:hypothetical protein
MFLSIKGCSSKSVRTSTLHGVLGSPFPSRTIVSSAVRLEQLRNIRHKRIIGVGVSQEGADTKQDFANGQCRTPLVLENIKTDTSVGVDVAMVNACGKVNLGRLLFVVVVVSRRNWYRREWKR